MIFFLKNGRRCVDQNRGAGVQEWFAPVVKGAGMELYENVCVGT